MKMRKCAYSTVLALALLGAFHAFGEQIDGQIPVGLVSQPDRQACPTGSFQEYEVIKPIIIKKDAGYNIRSWNSLEKINGMSWMDSSLKSGNETFYRFGVFGDGNIVGFAGPRAGVLLIKIVGLRYEYSIRMLSCNGFKVVKSVDDGFLIAHSKEYKSFVVFERGISSYFCVLNSPYECDVDYVRDALDMHMSQ
jgi:hypothetical protein